MEIKSQDFAKLWRDELKQQVLNLGERPECTIIIAKDYSPPSKIYVNNKRKESENIGITSHVVEIEWENKSKAELLQELKEAIKNSNHAVMVQDPFPLFNQTEIAELIPYEKDVDGFTLIQKGKLINGDKDTLIPCTPLGIIKLLEYVYPNTLKGKSIGIFSRSNLIGKPLIHLALQKNMTPLIIHTKSNYLSKKNGLNCDIVVTGCGQRKIFKSNDFLDVETIIDCSMNKVDGIPGVGDCDREDILTNKSNILIASGYKHTGTFTVLALMENIIKAYKNQKGIK